MPTDPPDPSVVQLPEPEWIGEALGTTITGLEAQLLGEARGFQSTTWRLTLRCDPPGSAPESVILKSETAHEGQNAFSRLNNAFGREVGVYNHCTPRLQRHRPVIYAFQESAPSWLLMEDLTHLRSGDQVIGLSDQETIDTLERMAAIHAEFWLDPGLQQHDWLPQQGFWFADPKPDLSDDFFATYGIRLGPEVCRLHRVVQEQSSAIDEAVAARPWTLVHGDLRADNVMLAKAPGDPASLIIDWSWASRSLAAIDIAFLIGGSTPPVQRLGRHEDLLQAWHGTLLNLGVRDYPLSEARHDLQLAALRCMTAAIVMHSFSLNPDTPVRAALFMDDAIQRHAAYATEIKAWEALPDGHGFHGLA